MKAAVHTKWQADDHKCIELPALTGNTLSKCIQQKRKQQEKNKGKHICLKNLSFCFCHDLLQEARLWNCVLVLPLLLHISGDRPVCLCVSERQMYVVPVSASQSLFLCHFILCRWRLLCWCTIPSRPPSCLCLLFKRTWQIKSSESECTSAKRLDQKCKWKTCTI